MLNCNQHIQCLLSSESFFAAVFFIFNRKEQYLCSISGYSMKSLMYFLRLSRVAETRPSLNENCARGSS